MAESLIASMQIRNQLQQGIGSHLNQQSRSAVLFREGAPVVRVLKPSSSG